VLEHGECGHGREYKGIRFLGRVGDGKEDGDLEEKLVGSRKRKREADVNEVGVGKYGNRGWKWREREARDEKRWKRMVAQIGLDEKGGINVTREGVPLPEHFKLGLDERGLRMNHRWKNKYNFGMNRRDFFSGRWGGGGKFDAKNWTASFMKSGCVSCQNEDRKSNHKGQD
jgi:hypothetical protein